MNYWLNAGDKLLNNIISFFNPSWPQTVLILGILIIFLFRKSFSRLIDRTKKISKSGVDFHLPQIAPSFSVSEELGKTQTTFSGLTSLPTIQDNITTINDYLKKHNLNDPNQACDFLKRELADVYFVLRCERIYYLIFGSQIQLLKKLLINQTTGLTQQAIIEHFENIKKLYPDFFAKWDISIYLYFLTQAALIINTNNNYVITNLGADFLTWLQRSGYPENKLF